MKKRNVMSILLYLLGAVLFVIANSSVVSGSPVHLEYAQRALLCGMAVGSVGTAPFVYESKTRVGIIVKFVMAAALICCMFAFGGFGENSVA